MPRSRASAGTCNAVNACILQPMEKMLASRLTCIGFSDTMVTPRGWELFGSLPFGKLIFDKMVGLVDGILKFISSMLLRYMLLRQFWEWMGNAIKFETGSVFIR